MINVEHCIKHQQHLPMHPEWWNKYKDNLQEALETQYNEKQKIIDKISKYTDKTPAEIIFLGDLENYLAIMRGERVR